MMNQELNPLKNEMIFLEYISEKGFKTLNSDWVKWMLKFLEEANVRKMRINPKYLRAKLALGRDDEPPMI